MWSWLPRRLEGPRANTKSGAHYIDCAREVWGTPPKDFTYFEVASEALFCTCIQTCIPASCYLHLAVSEKYNVHQGLASGLRSSHVKKNVCINLKFV